MSKKTGGEHKIFQNSTLLTAVPTLTAFPTGFSSNEVTNVRDVNKTPAQTTIDFGTRADPKEKRTQFDGITYVVTMFHDPADADYILFKDAADAQTPLALFFCDGGASDTPMYGDVANWNIQETGQTQGLRDGALTTFTCTIHSFYGRVKVAAS